MLNDAAASTASEWKANWRVAIAGIAGMMLGSLHAYSLGVMIPSLEQEFGWSRAQITSGMLLSSVFSVALSPFFGLFVDRFGPRRIGLLGVGLYCAALASLSFAWASIWSWLFLWALLALALLNIKPTVWVAAISGLFSRSRGLALAIVLSATGISQAITPIITYHLIQSVGWRGAYIGLGLGAASFAIPIVYFWFSSAQDRARTSKKSVIESAAHEPAVEVPGLSVREGIRSPAFLRLAVGALAMSLVGGAFTVNLVPVLIYTGLTLGTAASLAGLSGASAIVGRLAGGFLLDRFNARAVGGFSVLLPTISCAILLAAPGNLALAMVAVCLNGLAAGAEMDAIAYLGSRCFGLRNFGVLFGSLSGLLALGIGMGPTLANLVYDSTASYGPVLWAIIPLSVLGSLAFFSIGPYPDFEEGSVQRGA